MPNVKRLHFWVSGRVQNVGFRAYVAQQAWQLGLTGWVRNRGWDEVEALAEGDPQALQTFAAALQKGPSASRVDALRQEEEPVTGEFPRFEIRSSR
jgi:acylphosphatase